MQPELVRGSREWAKANGNVRQLWLFVSRAPGAGEVDCGESLRIAPTSSAESNKQSKIQWR
jgi:hypothetical protein